MKRIYLSIDDSRVTIGKLSKRGDFFICDPHEVHRLPHLSVKDGTIYNPSVLHRLITTFLATHKVRSARAVVCCPGLASFDAAKKQLALFQIALCVCKAGLTIEKLLEKELLSEIYEEKP